MNAIFYIAQTGCQWRMLPGDFPPFTTVQRYFYAWRDQGRWQTINHALMMDEREAEGREASPSAGVIDSQSAKTTEAGGPRGYDAGKKVLDRKRHILTDTIGLLVGAIVHPADVQDREGAPRLLQSLCNALPWLRRVFGDCAYAGGKLQDDVARLGDSSLMAGNSGRTLSRTSGWASRRNRSRQSHPSPHGLGRGGLDLPSPCGPR